MLPSQIVYISLFTTILASFFYLKDIIKGRTRPNLASWFIWFLAPTIAGFLLINKGGGISSLPVFMAGFTPFLVCIFALFKQSGYWKMSSLDFGCLFLALLAIIFWIFIKNIYLATIFAILADLIAFIPTYVKSWKAPGTEHLGPYFSGSFNSFLSMSTIGVVSFVTVGFAFYLFLGNLLEIIIVLVRNKYLKNLNKI
jgi:hypothetical protein